MTDWAWSYIELLIQSRKTNGRTGKTALQEVLHLIRNMACAGWIGTIHKGSTIRHFDLARRI